MDKPKSNDTSNSVVVISPIVLIVAKNSGNISPCIDDVPRAEEIPTNDVWLPTALLLIVAWHWIHLMISSFLHKFGGNFTSKCLQIQKDFNRNTRLFDWTYIAWHVTCHFHWAMTTLGIPAVTLGVFPLFLSLACLPMLTTWSWNFTGIIGHIRSVWTLVLHSKLPSHDH